MISFLVQLTAAVHSSVPAATLGTRRLAVKSTPWVRVSRPFVKYCRPPIPVIPLSARILRVLSAWKVPLSMMRWSILM